MSTPDAPLTRSEIHDAIAEWKRTGQDTKRVPERVARAIAALHTRGRAVTGNTRLRVIADRPTAAIPLPTLFLARDYAEDLRAFTSNQTERKELYALMCYLDDVAYERENASDYKHRSPYITHHGQRIRFVITRDGIDIETPGRGRIAWFATTAAAARFFDNGTPDGTLAGAVLRGADAAYTDWLRHELAN